MKTIHGKALLIIYYLTPFWVLGQYHFEKPLVIDYKSGLPSNHVTDIVEDQIGFIWIGTDRGVMRYDGTTIHSLQSLTLDSLPYPRARVNDLMVERESGHIWISTNFGLYVYEPVTKKCRTYLAKADDPYSLPHPHISYAFQDNNGTIWLAAFDQGLAAYQPDLDNFHRFSPRNYFREHTEDKAEALNQVQGFLQDVHNDDIYWLSTPYGLVRWDREQDLMRRYAFAGENLDKANGARCIYQHSNGWVLQGLWSGGFSVFDPYQERFHHSSEWSGEQYQVSVYSIIQKSDSELWISYSDQSLSTVDLFQRRFLRRWAGDRMNNTFFGVRYRDRQGRIWGGFGQGVHCYDPLAQQLDHFLLPIEGQPSNYEPTQALQLEDGNYLFCLYGVPGLYLFDSNTGEHRILSNYNRWSNPSFGLRGTDMIQMKDGNILVSDLTQVLKVDKAKRRLEPFFNDPPWSKPILTDMLQDEKGRLWFATKNEGLFRYTPAAKLWEVFKDALEPEGFPQHSGWLNALYEGPKGNIWLRASQGYSVYRSEYDTILNFPYQLGQLNNFVNVTDFEADDRGLLWVGGGEQGVGLIDPEHPERGIFKIIGPKQGLHVNPVRDLQKDKAGYIWMLDSENIARMDPETFEVYQLDQNYGIPEYDEILRVKALEGSRLVGFSDGQLGLLYRRGFAVFDPINFKKNDQLPKPFISNFRVFDRELQLDTTLFHKKAIQLAHRENFFSFELAALNYFAPEKTRFHYKLEGVDEDWVDAGTRRYVAYTNVPGGHHVLKVIAENNEGVQNLNPYTLSIFVATPWWETSWFYGMVGLLAVSALYVVYRARIRQFRIKEKLKMEFERKLASVEMRALRAQMNPHFIFNCLNSIDYFIIQNETENASDYLNRFSRLIRLILQNSRSPKINLRDELEALKLYIEMESLRFEQRFDYIVKVEGEMDLNQLEVPPMLLQPYVENAIWHGLLHKEGKGRLELILRQDRESINCIIQDNGIGRSAAAKLRSKTATRRKSFGMQISKDRLHVLNQLNEGKASVTVKDLHDHRGIASGTLVELTIPT